MDIWGFGCLFYEMLTLKPLFPGKDELDQIIREFCTVGFSAPGHFTKVGEFQEDLYNKLTTILRYQWWDGASIAQQSARPLAGTTLPNNHHVGASDDTGHCAADAEVPSS